MPGVLDQALRIMFLRLLLLLTVVPFVELLVLLRVAAWIKWWPTVGLILFTGALGAWLARREGLRVFGKIQADLSKGIAPTANVVDGVLVLVAGLMLVTPGILTDLSGFALLIPIIRRVLRRKLEHWFRRHVEVVHTGPQADYVDVEGHSYESSHSSVIPKMESQDAQ